MLWKGCSMIEEIKIPISFLDHKIEVLESELEYELYEDDDRKKCIYLSGKLASLRELRREWLNHETD